LLLLLPGLFSALLMAGCPSDSGKTGNAGATAPAAGTAAASPDDDAGRGVQRGLAGSGSRRGAEVEEPAAAQPPATPAIPRPGSSERWWGSGCDPHRTNLSPARGPAQPALKWTCDLGHNFSGRLSLLDGVVVAGLTEAAERSGFESPEERYAIDSDVLPDQVSPGVVVGVGTDGKVAWRHETEGAPLIATSLTPDARVYAQSWWRHFEHVQARGDQPKTLVMLHGELLALDPAGAKLWALGTAGAMLGDPLVAADGSIYGVVVNRENVDVHGYYDHSLTKANLVCYAPAGKERWRYSLSEFDDCWDLTPASQVTLLTDGSIGLCWNDFTLHVVKADGGKSWTYRFRSVPDTALAASPTGELLLLANDRPDLNDKQLELMNWEAMNKYGVLHLLKAVGSIRWNLQAGSDVHTEPAFDAAGALYFGATLYEHDREHLVKNGRIYAIAADKQLKWQYDTHAHFDDNPLQPAPVVDADGVLYVSDAGRHLYALNPDGTLKWEYAAPQGFATNPVLAPDGTLYIGGNDNQLYALGD